MTREEEIELAYAERSRQRREEGARLHAQLCEMQAPELAAPVPVIRDDLDAAFAALRAEEARS